MHMVHLIIMNRVFPPGIENTANICFASSTLQCLLNQDIFRRAFRDVGVSHVSSCTSCQEGKLHETIQRSWLTILATLPADSAVPERCMIAAVADLSKHYVYRKDSVVLSSANLVKSLQSKFRCNPMAANSFVNIT